MFEVTSCEVGLFPTQGVSNWGECESSLADHYGYAVIAVLALPPIVCMVPALVPRRGVAWVVAVVLLLGSVQWLFRAEGADAHHAWLLCPGGIGRGAAGSCPSMGPRLWRCLSATGRLGKHRGDAADRPGRPVRRSSNRTPCLTTVRGDDECGGANFKIGHRDVCSAADSEADGVNRRQMAGRAKHRA